MKLKYLVIGFVTAISTIGFSSCNNYLSVDRYLDGMLTADSIWYHKAYCDQWLAATYSKFNWGGAEVSNKGSQAFNFASDDLLCGDRDNLDAHYQNCDYSPTNNYAEDRWGMWYVGIRQASIFIQNIDKCKELDLSQREDYKAQARFLRAYFYWMLMRQYGPVPILPDAGQDLSLSYQDLAIPRSTYDQCVDFVTKEFATAAMNLPLTRPTSLLGQPTRGAALAARARAYLYAASPLYNGNTEMYNLKDKDGTVLINQTYDEEKWAKAAAAAKEVIDLDQYKLLTVPAIDKGTMERHVTIAPPYDAIGSNNEYPNGWKGIDPEESYHELFNGGVTLDSNPEAIFFRVNYGGEDIESITLHSVPHNGGLGGWNTNAVTQKQVDAYEMCDGRSIGNSSTAYPYISYTAGQFTSSAGQYAPLPSGVNLMYANREPRFYASIAYNGSIWENLSSTDQNSSPWNYQATYYKGGNNGKVLTSPENGWFLRTGVGLKKYYHPEDSWGPGGIRKRKTEPAIRYADVLLWYAEALNELTKSYTEKSFVGESITVSRDVAQLHYAVSRVRYRAGVPDYDAGTYANQDQFRTAIKHEYQIETFAEGKRYFDLRRWKDAPKEESMIIMGCNVNMSGDDSQKALFYYPTPTDMPKVWFQKMYLWPMPKNELDRNVKLTQNPGW